MDIGGVTHTPNEPTKKLVEDRASDAEAGKFSPRADADPAGGVSANPDDRVEPGVKTENDKPSPGERDRSSESTLDVTV